LPIVYVVWWVLYPVTAGEKPKALKNTGLKEKKNRKKGPVHTK